MTADNFSGGQYVWCCTWLTDERRELRAYGDLGSIILDPDPGNVSAGSVYWRGQKGIKGKWEHKLWNAGNEDEKFLLFIEWGAHGGYRKKHALQFFTDAGAWILVPSPERLDLSYARKFFDESFCMQVYEDGWWEQDVPTHTNNCVVLMREVMTTEQQQWLGSAESSYSPPVTSTRPPPNWLDGQHYGSNYRAEPY